MVSQKRRPANRRVAQKSAFGPVSTVNTAPVAIGNSIRGAKAQVTQSPNGANVVGRDFAFSLAATAATITGWELVGGMPITPCVMPSSILRNYCHMFSFFQVNKLMVHYITSSATSQTGDVMFYYERDRKSPSPDYSSNSFLPYVLSDSNTIIGPQWTNHTLVVDPVKAWKTTAFALNEDINEDATGSVFMYSKTSSANSPGYIIIDYDISFKEMAVNPRAGQLPISRGQLNDASLGVTAITTTLGTTSVANLLTQGFGLDVAVANMPTGSQSGDIYKVIVNATASTTLNGPFVAATGTVPTLSNLWLGPYNRDTTLVIDDGFTFYGRWADVTSGGGDVSTFTVYPTLEGAITGTNPFVYGFTATGATYTLICSIQLVSSLSHTLLQNSY